MLSTSTRLSASDQSLERQVRILLILDSAERAAIAPISVRRIHALAYLSNVLAPVWDVPTMDGKVLKRGQGPFYPLLQADLDSLVAHGLVEIRDIEHVLEGDRYRLDANYCVRHELADPVLATARSFAEEPDTAAFIQELTYALSALDDRNMDESPMADATFADPMIDVGSVIDFGEWRIRNASAEATELFARLIPGVRLGTRGELLHLYAAHIDRALTS